MFKIDEEVYYKGSEEKITPSEGEEIKKHFKPITTRIISLIHNETKMAVIKHENGLDVNIFIDSGIVPENYRDSLITVLLVNENTLEKIM
jgi:hypothetical protein